MSSYQTSISLPYIFSINNGKTNILSDYDSINNNIKLLLLSNKYELFGDPFYGSKLVSYLYETNNQILSDLIKSEIIRVLSLYETRISLNQDSISISYTENIVNVIISYVVNSTGSLGSVELVMLKQTTSN